MFRGQGERIFFSCLQHITIYKFWPWSSLSSLVPNTGSFLYGSYKHLHPMMSLASHSLTTQLAPCWAPGTDSAQGLQKALKWSLSHCRKANFAPGSQKVKNGNSQIASPQEKKQSKSLWGKRGWPLCPPCPTWWETLWRKHLWDPRGMSTMSYSIHSEHSREKYLLWCLLDFLMYNSPLTPLWPLWPPHGSQDLPRAFLPQGSALLRALSGTP